MSHQKVYSRSGVLAWSGCNTPGGGLVVAEAAQQIDLFRDSVSSFFDFVSVDDIINSDIQASLKPTCTAKSEFKFNDLAWAPFITSEHPNGLIIGCGESGHTSVFSGSSLKAGQLQCLGVRSFHQGHVTSVSVNPIDSKWVCTGGALGSVLLWDLNNPLNAITPGKPNFEHQIRCVGWNQCSEHILGSLTNERCSIWDLRSPGAPVLDIADIGGCIEWSAMKWSPICGTELCVTSQNDQLPLFYKWDLRYASSAVLSYQLHTKGILSMDWCPKDPEIVVTVGKDGQIIFQNPSTQKQIGLMTANGWTRKLSWCNSNPNIFAISYYDQPPLFFTKFLIAIMLYFAFVYMADGAHFKLKAIPAWLRPGPCGASFSFGNKFCCFSKQNIPGSTNVESSVSICKIEGSKHLHQWAFSLLDALLTNQLEDYCTKQTEYSSESDAVLKLIWTFLSARALNSSRFAYLSALETFLPSKQPEGKVSYADIVEQIKSWSLKHSDEKASEKGDESKDACAVFGTTQLPVFPKLINLEDAAEGDFELLKLLCTKSYMEGSAKALSEKNYLCALLLAFTADDQNIAKFISQTIAFDTSVSCTTRIMALMCAGLWEELISLWDVKDWASLFRLIVSQAPNEDIPVLCQKLSSIMVSKGFGLYAAVPAIVAGDVEGLLCATVSLLPEKQVALASILQQSIGGGSLRVASSGPRYLQVLKNCIEKLVKEGFVDDAWRFIEPLSASSNDEGFDELKYCLYKALGEPSNALPVNDPYSEMKNEFSLLNCLYGQAVSSSAAPHVQPLTVAYPSYGYSSQFNQMNPSLPAAPTTSVVSNYYQPPPTLPVCPQANEIYAFGGCSQPLQAVSPGSLPKPTKQYQSEPSGAGWNDPPQIAQKKTTYSAPVADIKWIPAPVDSIATFKPNTKVQPALTEQTRQLTVDDSKMIENFNLVIANIRQIDNSSITSHRTTDIEQKIQNELVPRLLKCSFTQETMRMLHEFARCLVVLEFQSCQSIILKLVGGGDFVELSPVMPGLKVLLQLAQRTFIRK
uniref:WD_REPEATS_REGION domain-containing protein n=1 Tax=Syphacia muris TaxID=451379 RepID=A0A0N5AJR8_9BILA